MKKIKKDKGYILLIVIIISAVIALVGAGLAVMNKLSFLSTRANVTFNKVQKAAHYGIMEATRRIVENGGLCEEGIVENTINVDGIDVNITTSRRGLVCSIRSEATSGNAKAVLVATIQGFYGIGTYTVKGQVNANIYGGLVSGCDSDNNCSIPGFIASGSINVTTQTGSCEEVDDSGVFGSPPTKPNVNFYDLVPLAFNANCFYELLTILETEDSWEGYPMGLGSNPLWKDENGTSRQDIVFDKGNLTSCPNPGEVDEAGLIMGDMSVDFPQVPSISPSCRVDRDKDLTLNLTTMSVSVPGEPSIDLSNCTELLINSGTKTLQINGKASQIKYIYTTNNSGINISGAENGTLINNATSEVEINSSFDPFVVYSRGEVTLNNVSFIRVVSLNNINIIYPNVSNSTLITEEDIVNNSNNLNLVDVNIFAQRLLFGSNTAINIRGGMLYLYTLADSNRRNNTVLNGCWYNNNCAWIGRDLRSANIGTADNPILLFLVNSATYIRNTDTVNINAVLFGQGVTYLTWSNVDTQNYRGILVRNFPYSESLDINFGSGVSLQFDYGIINTLNQNYWFVRKFECIKDDPLPYAQTIQTLHSSY
ncbi:MAG: hypothetical protein OD816_000821 [Thermodesulfobacterium sp.]|uniref:Uncharacterized protein n=1 Tax=Candidatus Thermodesulfobacterium syntrophicum TaxID=3060442 RepID=A0AAE3TEK8_9BACT|nr:hypothetical protein [Candidatus Thermodesulfobacterium syntrophicum]